MTTFTSDFSPQLVARAAAAASSAREVAPVRDAPQRIADAVAVVAKLERSLADPEDARSRELTMEGKISALRKLAGAVAVPVLREAQRGIEAARVALAKRKAALGRPKFDRSDALAAALRAELRGHLRAIGSAEAFALAGVDPDFRDAALEVSPRLSGMSEQQVQLLISNVDHDATQEIEAGFTELDEIAASVKVGLDFVATVGQFADGSDGREFDAFVGAVSDTFEERVLRVIASFGERGVPYTDLAPMLGNVDNQTLGTAVRTLREAGKLVDRDGRIAAA